MKLRKTFLIPYSKLDGLFNDNTTVYDECIDRSKLSARKNPFEYIVPPPPKEGWEQKSK